MRRSHQLFSLVITMGACGDDTATATDSTGATDVTTEVSTTAAEDVFAPWHGRWYALDLRDEINSPVDWDAGGFALAITRFELSADHATLQFEDCLTGSSEYHYIPVVEPDGRMILAPLDGAYTYPTLNPPIEEIYISAPNACDSLEIWVVRPEGKVNRLLPDLLRRGTVCLERCAAFDGDYGLISDCGTPVPWPCVDVSPE